MLQFSDRPLTSLFLLATLALHAVLPEAMGLGLGYVGFLVGQMMLLGAWTALGDAHRLIRGAAFVAGTAILAKLINSPNVGGPPSMWYAYLVPIALLQATAGGSAEITRLLCRRFFPADDAHPTKPIQFPVVELFGWTIVVAVASSLLRYATFENIERADFYFWLAAFSLAGTCAALVIQPNPTLFRAGMCLATLGFGCLLAGARLSGTSSSVNLTMLIVAYLYGVGFLVCRHLDRMASGRTTPPA